MSVGNKVNPRGGEGRGGVGGEGRGGEGRGGEGREEYQCCYYAILLYFNPWVYNYVIA